MDSEDSYEVQEPAKERPTMRMCRFISDRIGPCHGAIMWRLERNGSAEPGFYVCDAHLAAGARASGLPARIDICAKPGSEEDTVKRPRIVRCTAQ